MRKTLFVAPRLTCLFLALAPGCDSEKESQVPATSSDDKASDDKASDDKASDDKASDDKAPSTEEPTAGQDDSFVKDAELLTRGFEMKLKGELMAAMKEGGPAAAIGVCSQRAQAIAEELSTDELKVRRIGTRVRNPKNRPDTHDERALGALSAEAPSYHIADPPRFYRAIFAKPLCLSCHGSQKQLAPGVDEQLAKLYPQDEAIGYAAEDLRGAFVVERRIDSP